MGAEHQPGATGQFAATADRNYEVLAWASSLEHRPRDPQSAHLLWWV